MNQLKMYIIDVMWGKIIFCDILTILFINSLKNVKNHLNIFFKSLIKTEDYTLKVAKYKIQIYI